MKKKLLGLKLIRPEYRLAFREILKTKLPEWELWFDENWDNNMNKLGVNFTTPLTEKDSEHKSYLFNTIKEAGVESWFQKVYQPDDYRLYYLYGGILRKFRKKHNFNNMDSILDYLRQYVPIKYTPISQSKKIQFVVQLYDGSYNSEIVGILEHITNEDGSIELITNFIK